MRPSQLTVVFWEAAGCRVALASLAMTSWDIPSGNSAITVTSTFMRFVVDLLKRADITDLEILSVIAADILSFLSSSLSGRFYRAFQICFCKIVRSMTAVDKFSDGETAGP